MMNLQDLISRQSDACKPYPPNSRYMVYPTGAVLDTVTGRLLPVQQSKTGKSLVQMNYGKAIKSVPLVTVIAIAFYGSRPSPHHHARLIKPDAGYTAENVHWQYEQPLTADAKILAACSMPLKRQVKYLIEDMTDEQLKRVVKMIQAVRSDRVK